MEPKSTTDHAAEIRRRLSDLRLDGTDEWYMECVERAVSGLEANLTRALDYAASLESDAAKGDGYPPATGERDWITREMHQAAIRDRRERAGMTDLMRMREKRAS